jgi:AcrR family transcriptional regulator
MRPKAKKRTRTYTISLANRKPRGGGHERLGEILAAAKALFAEQGVENVTTREIAARVGISQAALFTYYRNKDEILTRLMEAAFSDLARKLDSIEHSSSDPREWLRQLIAGYLEFGLENPDEYRVAFLLVKKRRRTSGQLDEQPGIIQTVGLPVFRQLEFKIAQAMTDGTLRKSLGPPALVAQALWASIHGLTSLLIVRPRPHFPWADIDVLIRTETEMLLGGLLEREV